MFEAILMALFAIVILVAILHLACPKSTYEKLHVHNVHDTI